MKKCLCGLLALILLVTVAAGCTQKPSEPPSGIYYDVTGIDPRSTACTIDGVDFSTEMYLYWITYACQSLEYSLSMYYYYGISPELFDEDGGILWDAEFQEGQTIGEYAKEQAEQMLTFYAVVENMAKENGVELTDEDRAALDEEFASMVESMGGEEALQENLELMGVTRETLDRVSAGNRLADKLVELVTEEGSPLYLAPEEYEQYASYTDHILLSNSDQETGEPLSEEEVADKYATAQDLLAQLQSADDVEALFDRLAEEYSEDPGRAADKGYVVTPETNFVAEFLDAALTLEPGEVSEIVESTYGYHILYRRPLPPLLESSEEQRTSLASTYLSSLLQKGVEAASMTRSEEIEAIDVGTFYAGYTAKAEELTAARAAADSTDDAGGGTDGTADDAGTDGSADGAQTGGTGE